ncbi:16257_t:CDS:2, partial [Racocetra fulgida]
FYIVFTDPFLEIKKYIEQALECGTVLSLSGFVRQNTDLVVRFPPKGTDFNSLDGTWKKRFMTTAEIFNTKENKVVDGKSADLLAWIEKTGEEIFVGEQAGPPTKKDLTKLATNSFKQYREMQDCLNFRILQAMGKGDINYNNRIVFGVLGYLFEIKILMM